MTYAPTTNFPGTPDSDAVIDPYQSDSILDGVIEVQEESIVLNPYEFILGRNTRSHLPTG